MGSVMKPLATSPVFTDLMGKVSSIPVLGVLLGAAMTLVVQSSSATIAVLQNFASQAGPDGITGTGKSGRFCCNYAYTVIRSDQRRKNICRI